MLYSCNLFQPQIKHVAFTFSLLIPYESFTKQSGPACLCSGSPFPTLVSVMEQESSGWMLWFFQVKTSISFLGQAGIKGCCEVSYLSCNPLQCVPDWWQEGDNSCHPLLGLSARELHQAVSQRTVSAVPHGVSQQHHSQRLFGFL